jgi:hypothetical protein
MRRRYGEWCTTYGRVITKSLSSIGLKLFVALQKYENVHFWKLIRPRNQLFFRQKYLLLYMIRCSSTSWFRISPWFCPKMFAYFQNLWFQGQNLGFWDTSYSDCLHIYDTALWPKINHISENNPGKSELTKIKTLCSVHKIRQSNFFGLILAQ